MARSEASVADRTHSRSETPDTPIASYRLLATGPTVMIVALLAVLTAVAAWITARDVESMSAMGGSMSGMADGTSMSGMVNGLGDVGRKMPNDMGFVSFMRMWAPMMTAMMAPAVIPVVLAHRSLLRLRNEGFVSTAAFVAGYLAVWSLLGAAFFLPFLWFRDLASDAADSRWLPALAGAILVLAGAYQFTRRKTHCQGACCTPQATVAGQDAGPGAFGGFRTGAAHGVHCLGCCWALMTVLLVVGLMNLVWMVALALVFLAEKHWRQALRAGQAVGVGLVLLGLAVAVRPSLLPTISGNTAERAPMDDRGTMRSGSDGQMPPMPGTGKDAPPMGGMGPGTGP